MTTTPGVSLSATLAEMPSTLMPPNDEPVVLETVCVMIPLWPSRSLLITPFAGVGPITLMSFEPLPPVTVVVQFGLVPRTKNRSLPAPPSISTALMLMKLTFRPAPNTPCGVTTKSSLNSVPMTTTVL